MRAEHINPFIRSVIDTFDTMVSCKMHRGEIMLKPRCHREHPISGVIGMSGGAAGTVVINLSKEVALKAASTMLMDDIKEINDDVIDAVGELANMVAGQAKAELAEFDLSISLPNVVTGERHGICFPSSAQPITVPFSSDFGPLELVVGLESVCATVSA